FTIKDGSYGENTDPLRLKPYYEIYAETSEPIRSVSLRNLDTKDVKVKLHMSGYLNESHNPTLEVEVLNSEIGDNYQLTLTQMEILSILTFGDTESLSLTDVGTMSNSGREVMLRQGERFVGNSVARLAGLREARVNLTDPLNLESRSDLFLADRDFMVDPLLDLRNDFLLTLDDPISAIDPSGQIESTGLKEISKRLAITYSNKISYLNKLSENTPYIEVEYQINKHMSVAGERYRINQSTERYGIDLKLELEF
ncbi:MAG: translocation/assembly module TamB, partial [Candidatus Poribacteria bacterium]|nr:translocation/assembly module TamB [Candidatus Poribacteria bacterium]